MLNRICQAYSPVVKGNDATKMIFHVLGAVLAAAIMASCDAPGATVGPGAVLDSIVLDPATVTLVPGNTIQLTAVAKDSAGAAMPDVIFRWMSADTAVARVNQAGLVRAVAVGSATITATSGDKSSSAEIAVVSPSADESLGDTIFYEGFESGDLSAWDDGVDTSLQTIVNDPALVYAGERALEMTIPPGEVGSWLTRFFMPGYASVFVRFRIRYGQDWTGNSYVARLRGSRIDNKWSSFGTAGECPTGEDWFGINMTTEDGTGDPGRTVFYAYWAGMPTQGDGVTCYGVLGNEDTEYFSAPALSRGEWHTVEMWVNLDDPGQNNSIQKLWVDSELRGKWPGLNFRTTTDLRLNSLTIHAYDTPVSRERHIYYDEILVTTASPYSSSSQSSTAPVASVEASPSSASIQEGGTVQLTATPRDTDGNSLSGRTVTWASSDTAIAKVSTTGVVMGAGQGTATVTATVEGKSDSASITVIAPSPSSVPIVQSGDLLIYADNFEGYESTAELKSEYAVRENHGTVNLDETASATTGMNSYRIDYHNDGCLGGADTDVLLEQNFVDRTWWPEKAESIDDWYISYYWKLEAGFEWKRPGCDRTGGSKEFIVWRGNYVDKRLILTFGTTSMAVDANMNQYIYPNQHPPAAVYEETNVYELMIDGGDYDGIRVYRQHRYYGADEGPNLSAPALADGSWHHTVVHYRKESAPQAGDGAWQVWVDGYLVADFDGADPTSPAYGLVYTGTQPIARLIQYPSTMNGGSPKAQSRWFDNVKVWGRP